MSTNYHTPLSAGDPANAATFNTPLGELDQAITTLAGNIAGDISARVELASNQSIANNTATALSFGVEDYDTNAMWAVGTPTKLIIKTAGKFFITGNVYWAGNASGIRRIELYLNGSSITVTTITPADANNFNMPPISFLDAFSVNDELELYVYQNTGGALNALSAQTSFAAQLLSI